MELAIAIRAQGTGSKLVCVFLNACDFVTKQRDLQLKFF